MIFTVVSCSVYDASLMGSGPSDGGAGGKRSDGHSGTAGEGGRSGSSSNGGSSGSSSGDGGMMDSAGAQETGGEGAEGGTSGSSGSAGTIGGAGTAGRGGTAGSVGGGGTAGTAGRGGTAGGGTAGGATGGGGTAGGGTAGGGTAGAGGSAAGSSGATGGGGAGGAPPASGCAKLSVPIDGATDQAHFVIGLGASVDLSNATTGIVSMRVLVQAGAAGTVFIYVQDSQFRFLGIATAMRPALSGLTGWQTVSFNVGADSSGSAIAKTNITRVGIEINAAPATTGWSNPTIVYVDSITVGTQSFPLTTAPTVNTTPTNTDAPNQALFLNNGTNDTTAASVALSWQATCP